MTVPPEDLLDVASSIGDGRHLDWTLLSRSQGVDASLVDELNVIARIAAAHRAVPLSEPWSVPDPARWGDLQIREVLGRGAYGTVYRAWDPELERDVALKICRIPESGGEDVVRTEGRLLARVRHPNVVTVHRVQRRGSEAGLWLDLIEGRTLKEEVETNGPMGFHEAAVAGQEVCRALAAVHAAGLLHRDVKPQNVMRERGGRIVLTDMGISCAVGSEMTGGGGTPLFMAPELFNGGTPAVGTDIYSAGVLLFFLATGTHPVVGGNIADVERAHRLGNRRHLRDVRPDLPSAFISIVERACNPDPTLRYQTAGGLEAALGLILAPAKADGGVPHPSGRRRRVLVPVSIAGAVLCGAGVFAWVLGSTPSAPARPPAPTAARDTASASRTAPFTIEARFYRLDERGERQRLAPSGTVTPGDRLFLELEASDALHVYVVNHDDRGEAYLLFPLPGHSLQNPVPAGGTHRLPGPRQSAPTYWQVTSAGGREHFLLIASREPVKILESLLVTLPVARPGRPVLTAAPVPKQTAERLRGVGGITAAPPGSNEPLRLAEGAPALATSRETVHGTWLRRFTLNNPAR